MLAQPSFVDKDKIAEPYEHFQKRIVKLSLILHHLQTKAQKNLCSLV